MTSNVNSSVPQNPNGFDGMHHKKRQAQVTMDGGWGWAVVLGSSICHFFLLGINRSMGIVFLLFQEKFNATAKETALAASIFVSIRGLGGPVAGKLSDRFGCRSVTMIGGVLLCIGMVLSAFAINLVWVYITFGLIAGAGGVLVFSPSYIAVSQWFDKKKGKAMSLSTLGTGFGSIVMAPVMMVLVSNYGYFGTMLVVGALMLNNSVGGALYQKPPKSIEILEKTITAVEDSVEVDRHDEKSTRHSGDMEVTGKLSDLEYSGPENCLQNKSSDEGRIKQREAVGIGKSNNPDGSDMKEKEADDGEDQELVQHKSVTDIELDTEATKTFKDAISEDTIVTVPGKSEVSRDLSGDAPEKSRCRAFGCLRSSLWFNVPFILYCTMIMAVQGCIQSILVFLPGCGRELGASREQASLILTVFGVADMIGRFVFGFVFDLKFFREHRTHLYTAVATLFAITSIILGFMPTYLSLAAVVCLVAFFEGGAHSQRATNVTELVEPLQVSVGVGLVICFQGVGNFYGPIVGGVLKDRTNSYSTSFIFGGTTLLFACLLTTLNSIFRHQAAKRRQRTTEKQSNDA